MNGIHFFFVLPMAAALVLSSCEGVDSGGGGRVVNEPTVDEMARIDREMGLEPKKSTPRYSADDGSAVLLQRRPQAAPQPHASVDAPPVQAPQLAVPALPVIPPNSTLR